jgi:hypothetical protein
VSISFREFLKQYQLTLLELIPVSVITLATRISPTTTKEEFYQSTYDAVYKELTASINRFTGAKLDYRCIFDEFSASRDIPFSDRFEPNPEVATDTFQVFCRLRRTLENRIVFPSIGLKTVGGVVAESFWKEYYRFGCTFKHEPSFEPPDQVTPRDCLKLYEITGGYLEGPVEVRTAWKYSQISPRVYFARGGSVLPTSQYIQPIINTIIDAFPETHRINRFSAPPSVLQSSDVEVIYDYSSFTSTLDYVVGFVDSLAHFFRGTLITIIDVRDGPLQVDLGELLHEYNQSCNMYASFDIDRVSRHWTDDGSIILQHTCGMLGVEGNIFLATLLHGIHLRFISGLNRSRCVGDDARLHYHTGSGVLPKDERILLLWKLTGIGDMNEDKLAVFEEGKDPVMQAYRYVKRPIERDHDLMLEGLLFDIPSLIPLFDMADPYHTLLPSKTHPCRQTFKSIIRLLRILRLHNISLKTNEEGISVLSKHVKFLVNEIRRVDPESVHSPFAKSDIRTNYRLPSVKEWGLIDYDEWVMDGLGYETEVRFLKWGGAEDEECDGRAGSVMIRESNARRSFLEKLGYLQREDLYDYVSIRQFGLEVMREYLKGNYTAVCRFTVIEDIPLWYNLIPGVL